MIFGSDYLFNLLNKIHNLAELRFSLFFLIGLGWAYLSFSFSMDEAGPESLFVVVSYGHYSPCSRSIIRLDTQGHNPDFLELLQPVESTKSRASISDYETDINQKEYVAHFSRSQGPAIISFVFSRSSTEDEELLYMVPYWNPKYQLIDIPPLHGCIFNFMTHTCRPIQPPKANKFDGHVANHNGRLYFIAPPCVSKHTPNPSFERYDPAHDSWETLEPIPFDIHIRLGLDFARIEATVVFDDTILFNIGGDEFWAYCPFENKWYRVEFEDKGGYGIIGEAIVLDNIIYALAEWPLNLILALSITKTATNGCVVFKCRLLSEYWLQGLQPFCFMNANYLSRHLCHLGKDNFCLVESCKLDGYYDNQPIQLTNIKLKKEEKSMTVTGIRGHLLRILGDNPFCVDFCFSLPDSKTTALKEGQCSVFDLSPFPKGFDPHKKNKNLEAEEEIVTSSKVSTSLGNGVVSTRGNRDGEGHSVHVRNISPFATYNQLKEVLKTFGPFEQMEVFIKEKGEVYAIVEFESATSKQNAIKASPIVIEGYRTVIR